MEPTQHHRRTWTWTPLLALVLVAGCAKAIPMTIVDGGGPDWGHDSDGLATDLAPPPAIDPQPAPCGAANCEGCCLSDGICVAGSQDTQCGTGGAACVDCTTSSGLCEGNTCSNCTPSCSEKICGEADGCGGICTAGSNCCDPACSGKYCGDADGCGGTCKTGSGCSEPPCVATADPNTLALYIASGSGSSAVDATNMHPGELVGAAVSRVPGKAGCGQAFGFAPSDPVSYVEIQDSPEWDLAEGSVDFWVSFDGAPATGSFEGIVSRDAYGVDNPGHFTVIRMCNGSVAVRLQKDTNAGYYQCSDPVSAKSWHHVGINFGGSGGLELYVDGKLATRTTSVTCGNDTWSCGGSTTSGIAGNDNPWVLGAVSWTSTEGSATPVQKPMAGRLDSFRISSVRRSF